MSRLSPAALFHSRVLSVVGNILYFMVIYLVTFGEEEVSVLKWGGEYRQYMREVPKFNFIVGMWRLMKRR